MLDIKINSPWIKSRINPIFSLILDIISFSIFININLTYELVNSSNILTDHIYILFIWISISYIIGRYHFASNYEFRKRFLNIFKNLISCFLFFIFLKFLTFDYFKLYLSKEYILSFTIYIIINFILNNLFIVYLKNKNNNQLQSIYVGNLDVLNKIDPNLILNIFKSASFKNNKISNKITKNIKYIVIEKTNMFSENIFDNILYYQKKGVGILTLIEWCENHLERIPSFLITKNDLLNGFFKKSNNIELRIKRFGDFIFSLLLIIISFPIILTAILIILLEDGKPIFYSQIRTGKDGKNFTITKLRTMRVNAENKGPQWSNKNDIRITKVGYFLRKLRIDELPQLISVLKGEMSLIGPRPERPVIEAKFKKLIPNYDQRYTIRPGLSGWAQVNYPYGASAEDSANKLSYDLFYIKNFSILLDILIFIKTIKLVFNAKGAIAKK